MLQARGQVRVSRAPSGPSAGHWWAEGWALCAHVAGGVGAVSQWGLEVGVQE